MNNDQVLFELKRISAQIEGLRDSRLTRVVDMGLGGVLALLGLILWRIW
ncbi:hypothetical protein GCM10008943_34030 [Paenochrobactrum glaciei]|uniref:Uncharacterized protein n=2 Tax=Bacteria TaxID=2 RepID=A0ABP3RSS1_9HYPH